MNQIVGPGQPSQPHHGQDVAGVRGTPHLQPLPGGTPLLDPGWQVTARGADHRDLVSRIDGGLNQIPDAHGHTIDGDLGNNENARGLSRRRKGSRTSVTADFQPASKLTAPSLPFTPPKHLHLRLVASRAHPVDHTELISVTRHRLVFIQHSSHEGRPFPLRLLVAAIRPIQVRKAACRRFRTQCFFRMPLSGSVSVRTRMTRSSQSDQCSM